MTLNLHASESPDQRVAYRSADGELLTAYGDKAPALRYNDYPRILTLAVKIREDRSFDTNVGVSVRGKVRALYHLIRYGSIEGGSSLTEQLVKLRITGRFPWFLRKPLEPFIAVGIRWRNGPDVVMAAYLASASFARGTVGAVAASRLCWGKEIEQLTVNDAALLAVAVQAPARFDCGRGANVSAKARIVLDRMVVNRGLTPSGRSRVRRSPVAARRPRTSGRSAIAWCTDWVRESYPSRSREARTIPVGITCDSRLSAAAQNAVTRELTRLPRHVQAAVVAVRADGALLTMLGGRTPPQPGGGFNHAIDAVRDPASTIKTAGLDTLLRAGWSLDDVVSDSPGGCDGYDPGNADGKFMGSITLRDAFALSRNEPFLKLLCRRRFYDWPRSLVALGLWVPAYPRPSNLISSGKTTLVQSTLAVAAIVGGSGPTKMYAVVGDRPALVGRALLPAAPGVCEAMSAVVSYGTGRAARVSTSTIGKTGSAERDAYFLGAVGDLVVGVWLGTDSSRGVGTMGGVAPARIFRSVARDALKLGLVHDHTCGTAYHSVGQLQKAKEG